MTLRLLLCSYPTHSLHQGADEIISFIFSFAEVAALVWMQHVKGRREEGPAWGIS